jgi:uncharacterized protein YggE
MVRALLISALLLAKPTAVFAQQSPYPPTIAKGEVLLQISADGEDRTVADRVTIVGQIVGRGKDAADARQDVAAQRAALIRTLASLGVVEEQITQPAKNFLQSFDRSTDPVDAEDSAARPFSRDEPVMVELSGIQNASQVRSAMETAGVQSVGNPVFMLSSDTAAQQRAVTTAIANARSQAEMHAAPLGMKVLRIARVSNDNGGGLASLYGPEYRQMTSVMMANFGMGKSTEGDKVVTTATVWVDFILGPK